MTTPIRIQARVRFDRGRKGRKVLKLGEATPQPRVGRIPRVARLLALAHWFEKLIGHGAVRDYADLARLGHVTRARLTQIMNLLNLAPEIQEEILWLPVVENGGDPIHERQLRRLVAVMDWKKQRRMFVTFHRPRRPCDAEETRGSNRISSSPEYNEGLRE
jgi:hypothetical protein